MLLAMSVIKPFTVLFAVLFTVLFPVLLPVLFAFRYRGPLQNLHGTYELISITSFKTGDFTMERILTLNNSYSRLRMAIFVRKFIYTRISFHVNHRSVTPKQHQRCPTSFNLPPCPPLLISLINTRMNQRSYPFPSPSMKSLFAPSCTNATILHQLVFLSSRLPLSVARL